MPDERVQRQIDRILDEIDDAMAQTDWELVHELVCLVGEEIER